MASSCQELIRAVIEPRPDALTPCLPIPKMKTLPKNQTPAVPQPRLLDLREEPAPEILWFLMPDASWDFFFFSPSLFLAGTLPGDFKLLFSQPLCLAARFCHGMAPSSHDPTAGVI